MEAEKKRGVFSDLLDLVHRNDLEADIRIPAEDIAEQLMNYIELYERIVAMHRRHAAEQQECNLEKMQSKTKDGTIHFKF